MASALASLFDTAQDAYFSCIGSLCKPDANIKLNGRTFKILKLLGEGGFAYVYLVEDSTSGRLFALKKIRCPLGSEQLREVMKEVEASKRFKHPNCIRCLDSCVVQEKDGKVVYLFLPYYKRGNLQDAISQNAVNGTSYPEKEMLQLFLGTCKAVRAMHTYVPGPQAVYPPDGSSADDLHPSKPASSRSSRSRLDVNEGAEDDEEGMRGDREDQQDAPLIGEGDHRGGEVDDPTEEGEASTIEGKLDPQPQQNKNTAANPVDGEMQPWAHRDIKPANVMISDDGKQPILMDFGSAIPARIPIKNRSAALAEQDRAAEHSTMPYRAPELFDVKSNVDLDEKVDIWSLGCTLFALAYGTSPFETNQSEQGGSIALAVLNGSWKFPANDQVYSQGFRDLISAMMVLNPASRPDLHKVIELVQQAIGRLQ